jgi:hypothetical protein
MRESTQEVVPLVPRSRPAGRLSQAKKIARPVDFLQSGSTIFRKLSLLA